MGLWQTLCTCAGCAIGAACVIMTGGTASAVVVPLLIASGGGAIAGNLIGSKLDQEETKTKNQAKDLEIRGQTIETLKKDNEKLHTEINELKNKHEELDSEEKQKEKELEHAKNKANDSSLSEEERTKWRRKVVVLEEELGNIRNEKKEIADKIKDLNNRIKDNNKNITSVGKGSDDGDKKGIMAFLTLENILICLAIYAVWQIAIKDDRRY
ncbi:hypothetical protein [endosymbiont GvMRE of Glomus versiforme]|uniref:hypothetical protein n=1 Tax=endosymbiont GvMRE of Glomus versiforme TaxID=2039283 RepID=UPI000EE93455|nr:hypothetical protein [endosymbiont GvMRE of Glomus versiforme]RHZ37046.1 hypothetical protein GvMRE_I2g14 [endosymbiont GvMRE of Glomus versiforme]